MLQAFNCPHCGAPGSVVHGQATYTCLCRFGTTYQAQHVSPPICPNCQHMMVSIPRMGIHHVCGGGVEPSPQPATGEM